MKVLADANQQIQQKQQATKNTSVSRKQSRQVISTEENQDVIKQKESSKQELEDGVKELNEAVQALHKDLKFELHEKSKRMMVKVMDLDKREVIKEIPAKEVLDMIGRIKEMVGLIIDEKI